MITTTLYRICLLSAFYRRIGFVNGNTKVLWVIQLELLPSSNFRVVIEPFYQGLAIFTHGVAFLQGRILPAQGFPSVLGFNFEINTTTILTLQKACLG